MNLSSVLITTKEEFVPSLLEDISHIEYCSVELSENGKIIVVIESEDLDQELRAYRKLEQLANIIDINMIFSYQDLDEELQKIEQNNVLETLNQTQKAENIHYSGDIFQKLSKT